MSARVSDVFDPSKIKRNEFNLIAAGCGTGKSYFVANKLGTYFPEIKDKQIIWITSRSLTVDQQSVEYDMQKFDRRDASLIRSLSSVEEVRTRHETKTIMTYDKIIGILNNNNNPDAPTLAGAKIIILDECHTMFCDAFVFDMHVLLKAIKDIIDAGNTIVIGMTATPEIVYAESENWGVHINPLLDDVLTAYKAKKLVVSTLESIPQMIKSGYLKGRTMIMCTSVKNCVYLRDKIPNSTTLFAVDRMRRLPENERVPMEYVRKMISQDSVVPERYLDYDSGEWRPLDVLICTSTAREGFNLIDTGDTSIRNIICCYSDSIYLTQFAGRARYDLDTIVVADTTRMMSGAQDPEFMVHERELFADYMKNPDDREWFDTISRLVSCSFEDIELYAVRGNPKGFLSYIDNKWVSDTDNIIPIYRQADRDEILKQAIKYGINKVKPSKATVNAILKMLVTDFGYSVVDETKRIDGKPQRYKLIYKREEG